MILVVTLIAAAPAVVFDLELDADVHTASLAGSGERATTSTGRPLLGLHDEVTFRARHFGLPWSMTSRITAFECPRLFVDTQVRGPFRSMRHEHLFEDLGAGTTRMTDRMVLVAPGGRLGALVGRLVLEPYLRRLLEQRAAHIKLVAESSGS